MSGPLFVDSIGGLTTPGVGAVDVQAPVVIEGIPNGKMALAGQFDWGPINVVYEPTDTADFLTTYAPPGTPRTSSGYRSLMRRKGLALSICRVLHPDAVKAVCQQAGTGGNVTATAKYEGVAGNNLKLLIEASSDGVVGSKKFTVYWTDAVTGTFKEVIADNIAPPNSVAVTIDVSSSKLLSSFTIDTATTALPANSTYSFGTGSGGSTAGTNGSAVTSSDYTSGLALLDLIDGVLVMTTDDCGDSLRTAVLSGLNSQTTAAAGRYLALLQGASGNAWSAVKTDKASYTSKWCLYFASWANVLDDSGTARLVPTTTFAGTAIINLDPGQSHAWASQQATKYYDAISSLYTASFNPAAASVQADAMNLGIQIMQKEPSGGFSFSHDRNANTTVADRYTVTSKLRRFFALSLTTALREFRNAPNIASVQNDIVKAVRQFFDAQVRAGRAVSYVVDANSNNTLATVAQGYFILAIDVLTPAPMERIVLLLKAAPTVTVETPTT